MFCAFVFLATLYSAALGAAPVFAAAQSPFQTPEYEYISPGTYNSIDLSKAYELGFTGQGVTLGIVDDGLNKLHSEFKDKIKNEFFEAGYVTNWNQYKHGTLFAGATALVNYERV